MNPECDYSFEMLYRAAYGNSLPKATKLKLQSLPQEKINQLVARWATKAGWVIEKKIGTDGIDYLAFYPSP